LRPGGRIVTLDNCFVRGQSLLAKILIKLDRGRFVRSPAAYAGLACGVFSGVTSDIRHDLLKPIPYTHYIQSAAA
jgi:hypothetical protein